jgi:hypothetical protein
MLGFFLGFFGFVLGGSGRTPDVFKKQNPRPAPPHKILHKQYPCPQISMGKPVCAGQIKAACVGRIGFCDFCPPLVV